MSAPELSVVIPACSEEANLRFLLPQLQAVLAGLGVATEVVVIDSLRSRDRTRQACEAAGARWVPCAGADRYGDAVRTGIAEAAGRRVLFMDADGSHPPEVVALLWARRGEADVVAGSRYAEGGGSENSALLRGLSVLANAAHALVLGVGCRDSTNSLKLYRAGALKSLTLNCDDFDVIEEILVKLKRAEPGLRIVEVPFTLRRRVHGESKRRLLRFIVSYARTMLRLRLGSG